LLVCLVGLFCLFKFRSLVLALFMGSYLLFARSVILHPDTPSVHMRFLAYFSAGMCAWLWRDKLPFRWSIAIGLAALLAASVFANISVLFMSPFALTYLAMRIGYAKPFALTKWCDTTDLSYGVYLYAFPIQQLLALSPALHNPWRMVAAAVPLSLLAAFASWHLVEKRFLRLKKYRFVDEDPGAATPVSPSIVKDLEQAF
ncbi:MAG: acyltransferase, partial [Pedosphaera sp.]|nr:acyltransferase [Pedosphaera sp.]